MKYIHRTFLPFLLVCLSLALPANVFASEMIDHSSSLFNFQQKLANKGNARAQYKLATMYEAGIGVESDIEMASQWYVKASNAGIKAASDRNTFLEVKQQGYKKADHQSWLEGIKTDAKKHQVEAMLLLGQLYCDGIGVKKDLNRSLELLTQASSSGDVNVDDQIISLLDKIEAQKIVVKPAPVRQSQKKRKSIAVKVKPAKAPPAKTSTVKVNARSVKNRPVTTAPAGKNKKQLDLQQVKAQQIAESERLIKAEKRRKYEAVMAQIRLEQQTIDEQQAEVSGDELAVVDDEI